MLEQAEGVQNRDLEDIATSVRFQINMAVAVNFFFLGGGYGTV